MYYPPMPRAPTTLDCFNAIAEHRRRQVLDLLARGERPVSELVQSLGWPQPLVSKHLGVLKKVGLVSERRVGRQRVYRVQGEKLRPIHDWVQTFAHFWAHQLDRVKARAEERTRQSARGTKSQQEGG
jgi:DNA-binding transcriptional ArsR family regulator